MVALGRSPPGASNIVERSAALVSRRPFATKTVTVPARIIQWSRRGYGLTIRRPQLRQDFIWLESSGQRQYGPDCVFGESNAYFLDQTNALMRRYTVLISLAFVVGGLLA